MFQSAYRIASAFTLPVVISTKTVGGKCASTIGSCVVVNSGGHVVTAAHIVDAISKAQTESDRVSAEIKARQIVVADTTLDAKERRRRLQKLPNPSDNQIERFSAWWGFDDWKMKIAHSDSAVDLAIVQLENFDPTLIATYPVFKDPTKEMLPGRSLCKLGFPFFQVTPTWDANSGAFRLPPDSTPMPLFPIEGMFTRALDLGLPGPSGYARLLVETSSPGLRGQSGGPTFDVNGTVWAIQSKTVHQPLGFDPVVPGRPNQREHQFMNLGFGVHSETVIGMLRHLGVAHEVSDY